MTAHPTAAWTTQQVVEAFPWDTAPKYLLRDPDKIYGNWFRGRSKNMGKEEVLTAYHSPWQNPYSERLKGSIRRLDYSPLTPVRWPGYRGWTGFSVGTAGIPPALQARLASIGGDKLRGNILCFYGPDLNRE